LTPKGKGWLLGDFHIHTRWSDGHLSIREVVDLYGSHGFDVIAITDHVFDAYTLEQRRSRGEPVGLLPGIFNSYLKAVREEARRAWREYRMLVLPGWEITNDRGCYHIVGIDVKDFIDPDLTVEEIVEGLRQQGALAIAAHPGRRSFEKGPTFSCQHLKENMEQYRHLFDAWEIANRYDFFYDIWEKGLKFVAGSDFHREEHLNAWKTLIKTEKDPEGIKAAIRENSQVSAYLSRPAPEVKPRPGRLIKFPSPSAVSV